MFVSVPVCSSKINCVAQVSLKTKFVYDAASEHWLDGFLYLKGRTTWTTALVSLGPSAGVTVVDGRALRQ